MLGQALARERQAIDNRLVVLGLADPDRQQEKLNALLDDLRRRRLLQPRRRAQRPLIWSLGLTLAAAIAWFALTPFVAPPLPPRAYDEPPVWRGPIGVLWRRAADPRHEAEALTERLRNAQVDAAIYQRDRVFIVEVDVSPATRAAIVEILDSPDELPRAGPFRIEFASGP